MIFSLYDQLKYEYESIKNGYPDFVHQRKVDRDILDLPVFVFHSIEPKLFEEQLKFLNNNSYKTLSIGEYVACIARKKEPKPNSVLLTIDDARSSVWRYGFPLLKKYNIRATLFVIPGVTDAAAERRVNLDNVWQGMISSNFIKNMDEKDETLCTWPEIKKMHESGLVDIESHSLFHKEVFVGNDVLDFVDKDTPFTPYATPLTAYWDSDILMKSIIKEMYYGLPLFKAQPFLKGEPSIKLDQDLLNLCRAHYKHCSKYEKNNGNWKRDLKSKVVAYIEEHGLKSQSKDEVISAIKWDLSEAKKLIMMNVGNDSGHHFCLPYSAGSTEVVEAVRELGIKSCFWGVLSNRKSNYPNGDVKKIVRIKNDFLWRLPGVGRKSLAWIYFMKIRRRFSSELPY